MDLKRVFDLTLASALLVLLSPLFFVCALVVALGDGFPIIFWQERIGLQGRPFWIAKFRTMRAAAGALVTTGADPRITSLGRSLRRLKLDELPQLWNVVRGEMSLVGPRAEVPLFVARHPRWFRAIAPLRPGITDWSSLAFRAEEAILLSHASNPGFYDQVLLPRKIALARLYGRRRSMLLDLALIAATAAFALRFESLMTLLAGRKLLQRARDGISAA